MEHNNIYIYLRGGVDSLLGKQALFVFPYTETSTTEDMYRYIGTELRKIQGMGHIKINNLYGYISRRVYDKDVVKHKSKRAILLASKRGNYVNLKILPFDTITSSYGYRKDDASERKMNTMIKLYESIAEETSPKELKKRLDAGSIFYYDAQSTAGVSTFDKRSPEGKALISAKRIVQREKLLAQRGYSINTKLKDLNVGMSNMEVKDN